MKLLLKITFILFFFSLYAQQNGRTKAKDIVVFLDNSSSMNGDEDWDQCVNANYAMQLFTATLAENDHLHLIQAVGNSYRTFNNRQDALRYIKNISCSQADEDVALEQAIQIYKNITNDNKLLILIGDGQWFGLSGLDYPEAGQKKQLNDFFSKIDNNKIIYINTNKKGNINNRFYNEIYKDKGLKILQTDNDAGQLQSRIKDVIKKMLNIGKNGLSKDAYKIDSNTLVIGTNHLPIKKIFIIDQSGYSTQPIVTGDVKYETINISSGKGNKKPLSANFIIIEPVTGSIKKTISVAGVGNRNVEIYAVADFEPEFVSNEEGVKFDGELYTICKDKKHLRVELKVGKQVYRLLKDNKMLRTKRVIIGGKKFELAFAKNGEALSVAIPIGNNESFIVELEDKAGTFKKTYSKRIKTKDCSKKARETAKRRGTFTKECVSDKTNTVQITYTLPKLGDEQENISVNNRMISNYVYVKKVDLSHVNKDSIFWTVKVVYGKYQYKDSIKLWKRMCAVSLHGKYRDTVSYSMLNSAKTISWHLKKNDFNDKNSASNFIIKDKEKGDYSVSIDKEGNLILHKDNSFQGIIANCLRSTADENFSFELTHPDAYGQSLTYNVVIQKTDTAFWVRCYREIIGLIILLLFLFYLFLIYNKPRFKRKARITRYHDKKMSGRGTVYKLSSWNDFIDRYVNPFGVQTKIIDGIKYKAVRGNTDNIEISGSRISDNMGSFSSGVYIPFQPLYEKDENKKKTYSDKSIRPNDVIYRKRGMNIIYYYRYTIGKRKRRLRF